MTAQVEELREKRENALLSKWADGKRLSPDERADIAHLIGGGDPPPVPEGDGDPQPGGKLNGVQLSGDGDLFGDVPAAKSLKGETVRAYSRTLAEYAEIFQRSTRVLKGWIATGRKRKGGPDLPPLDDPRSMVSWWRRNKKQRVPPDLIELAQNAPLKKQGGGGPVEKEQGAAGAGPPEEMTLPDGTGFAAELERIREKTRVAAGKLEQAERTNDELTIETANKRYSESLKLLREFERDAQAILEKQGDLIPRQALEISLRESHSAIRDRLRVGLSDVRPQLATATGPEDEREVWDRWLDSIFRMLAETGFIPQLTNE